MAVDPKLGAGGQVVAGAAAGVDDPFGGAAPLDLEFVAFAVDPIEVRGGQVENGAAVAGAAELDRRARHGFGDANERGVCSLVPTAFQVDLAPVTAEDECRRTVAGNDQFASNDLVDEPGHDLDAGDVR